MLSSACRPAPTPPAITETCQGCHPSQFEALARSHHAQGQQRAGALPGGAVAGFAIASSDGGARVSWHEPDGGVASGAARFTLGVEPLVQVAVELPDGRLQIPPLALVDGGWREVPSALGGVAGDWRGPAFSWNAGCAPCHATGFVVGAREDGGLTSRWAALAVTCEACHGADEGHRAWLRAGKPPRRGSGFALDLAQRATFAFPDGGAIARPDAVHPDVQSEVCGACHSRRRALTDDGAPAGRLFERVEPALLARGLYEPNGAVLDEVYELGSFLQSPMQRAGVRCTDCHEPHAATLRAAGDALCARCHRPEVFATRTHRGSDAGTCVGCHLAEKRFLGVDVRHDHFIRRRAEGGDAFAAAWAQRPDADARLLALVGDRTRPVFQRASALALLTEPSPAALGALAAAVGSDEPWLRYGAATALPGLPPPLRARLGAPLLDDPFLAIRVRAARALAGVVELSATRLGEVETAERANATRGEAWLNLGSLAAAQGDRRLAEARWRAGLLVDPAFAPLAINLADLLRETGRDAEGRQLLERAASTPGPWDAPLAYARGLAAWRAGEREQALAAFAAARADGDVRHLGAWCLAVRELRGLAAGRAAVAEALKLRPDHPDLLALAAQWR